MRSSKLATARFKPQPSPAKPRPYNRSMTARSRTQHPQVLLLPPSQLHTQPNQRTAPATPSHLPLLLSQRPIPAPPARPRSPASALSSSLPSVSLRSRGSLSKTLGRCKGLAMSDLRNDGTIIIYFLGRWNFLSICPVDKSGSLTTMRQDQIDILANE